MSQIEAISESRSVVTWLCAPSSMCCCIILSLSPISPKDSHTNTIISRSNLCTARKQVCQVFALQLCRYYVNIANKKKEVIPTLSRDSRYQQWRHFSTKFCVWICAKKLTVWCIVLGYVVFHYAVTFSFHYFATIFTNIAWRWPQSWNQCC